MSKVQVVYVKRRGSRTIAKINPQVTVSRPIKDERDLTTELRQARVVSAPRYVSSVYKWGA